MRYLILIAGLALAAGALAEDKPKTVTKELDKSSPILMTTGGTSDSTEAPRAGQRSVVSPRDAASGMPTGKRTHAPAGDLDHDGRPDLVTCGRGVDDDCDDTSTGARPASNHNTTRPNRTRAQDYNSSRSNNESTRLDPDSDGDSVLTETRCSMAGDDCVEYQDGDDPILRKRPGR